MSFTTGFQSGRERGDNVNEIEAETIASLICAATEQPEYAKNDEGKPTCPSASSHWSLTSKP